jgi:alkanesulfonate monooxygenase SsuD/methylene tetrahydromethanopterin reductase-like flavin-dependent oxidoreductase (luciferase family)
MAGGGIAGRAPALGGSSRHATVGLVLPTFPQAGPLDPGLLRATVAHAEAAGIDALWACDHLFWHGPVVEAFTALATAAATTTRCALGTAVLQLALRRPAVVAKTAASLQLLSGGRFVLGVGAGVHEGEFAAAGVDFPTRGRQVDAALDELERLWAPADDRYEQLPAPSPVPVWIGGSSDPALRRAARRGAGWIPMFLSPPALRDRYAQLGAEAVLAGRRPDDVTRAVLLFVHVDRRAETARRRGLAWMSSLYGLPADRLERHLVAGTPDACVDRIGAYVEAGAQHLCLFVADDDPVPHLDAILGGLRSAAPAPPPGNGHAIEPVRAGDPPTRTVHP